MCLFAADRRRNFCAYASTMASSGRLHNFPSGFQLHADRSAIIELRSTHRPCATTPTHPRPRPRPRPHPHPHSPMDQIKQAVDTASAIKDAVGSEASTVASAIGKDAKSSQLADYTV